MDLVAELKERLKIADLVGKEFEVIGRGRELIAKQHDSLKVYPEDNAWRWYSQGLTYKNDCLAWIAYRKFGNVQADGERFIEVLREGCAAAGIAFPEQLAGGKGGGGAGAAERLKKATERRSNEEILERYLRVAESLRTPEFFARASQIGSHAGPDGKLIFPKAYLTKEVCERWRLAPAPTLPQCARDASLGVTEPELRKLGLLCDGRDGPYMFFHECLLIPFLESGRVTYFNGRFLRDYLVSGAKREKKTLHMPACALPRPCGFNLDVLRTPEARERGVALVEGCLDALAATERGQPAIAMLGTHPSDDLVKRLKMFA